jgi:hypothetical protein
MASIIRIKRSTVAGNPATLGAGELAYSALTDNGSNGGDRLYIGIGTETSGNAANHVVIGGKYFTDLVSAATNANTASAIVKRDASGNFSAGTITASLSGTASTATALATGRTIALTGDVTYTSGTFDGTANVTGTATLANTAVTAGSYGSATAIPVFTVDAKGRLTAASTASITTTLGIAGDTGTDSVALATDTVTFVGGTGITSAVAAVGTATSVTFDIDSTVATLTGTQTLTNKTLTSPVINTQVTTGSTSIDLWNATATTINFAGAATALSIGAATGTLTIGNPTITGTTATAFNMNGASPSIATTSTGTASVFNTNALTGALFGAASAITIGNTTFGRFVTSSSAVTISSGTNTVNSSITLAPQGTGTVDVSNKRITSLADPSQAQDAATKAYVDSVANGLDVKTSVRAASTAALTVSYSNGTSGVGATLTNADTQAALTLDSIVLSVGERVLIKDQAATLQNGVYVVTTVGSASINWVLTRATDFDNSPGTEVSPGTFFFVEEGTTQADNGYVISTNSAITIGTTGIVFSQFSGAGQITAGDGLTKTGNTINAVGTSNRISISADAIDISTAYVGQATITTLGTIGTGTWQGSVIGATYGGTGVNNGSNTLTLAGNVSHAGLFTQTFTATANTSVTLPTTGTLATLAGTEALSNKTITLSSFSGTTIAGSGLATFTNATDASALGTAAVVLSGGLSVAKTIYVGLNITGAGAGTSTLDGFQIDGGTY